VIWRLKETHAGLFENTFTLISHFKYRGMDTNLESGVLSTKLLKDRQADKEAETSVRWILSTLVKSEGRVMGKYITFSLLF
jgi:hypothetical protein